MTWSFFLLIKNHQNDKTDKNKKKLIKSEYHKYNYELGWQVVRPWQCLLYPRSRRTPCWTRALRVKSKYFWDLKKKNSYSSFARIKISLLRAHLNDFVETYQNYFRNIKLRKMIYYSYPTIIALAFLSEALI